jgi:hypothetical protein
MKNTRLSDIKYVIFHYADVFMFLHFDNMLWRNC